MEWNKEYEYFWQQYHGLVKAEEFPMWYIHQDTRIHCCNTECHIKEKCVLYERFMEVCRVFHQKPEEVKKVTKSDLKGWPRPQWDKYYPQPDYRNGSFAICPEQNGITCKYRIKI